MRIGIDARLYRSSVAGIGRYSQNLIKNLLEIDHENQYVLLMTSEDAAEFRSDFKIQDTLRLRSGQARYKIQITDIPHYSLAEQTQLPKIIEQEKCDLWHFLNFNIPVKFKGKFIVTIHDLTLFYWPGRSKKSFIYRWAFKYIFKKAIKNSQKIIAVSKSTKNDIIDTFKTKSDKIEVIYEAADDKSFENVDVGFVSEVKKRYNILDEPVILYVGQWRQHKNIVNLVKAFEILRKQMPAKLVLVGKEDAAYPEVQITIDKTGISRDIIKPGFVSNAELAAWYKIAKVFVFPSFYEGFGLPGVEAMMAGLPVASSDRTSLPEIYKDAAIYFNPDDAGDMAQKIQKVITDEKLRNNLINAGHKIATNLSWAKAAQETLEVYKNIK